MPDPLTAKAVARGPEASMLLAGARTLVDGGALVRICKEATGGLDWDRLERLAEHHGVTPLLYANLGKHVSDAVPKDVFARLRERVRANVHHSLFLASELVKLMRRFDESGIHAIPFKGPALAAYAYHDLTAREFTDLDIFVSKSRIVDAAEVVMSEGYVSSFEDPGTIAETVDRDGQVAFLQPAHYTFYRPDGRSRVDLQWRVVADRHFAQAIERPDLWKSEFCRVRIGGYDVRTFSATDTLLVLCIHGSKHGWEKLKWLCDIAELLRAQASSIDWSELQRVASELRVERMTRLGLALACDLLDATIPSDVAHTVASDRQAQALARELRDALFDEDRAPAASEAGFYLRLKDGWLDRVQFRWRYGRQLASRVFTPTAGDHEVIPLPRSLRFLYYIVRPVRLSVGFVAALARAGRGYQRGREVTEKR